MTNNRLLFLINLLYLYVADCRMLIQQNLNDEKQYMRRPYLKLWLLLVLSLGFFVLLSTFKNVRLFGHDLALMDFGVQTETFSADSLLEHPSVIVEKTTVVPDSLPDVVLVLGDSMMEWLCKNMAAYFQYNGSKCYAVVWYGSTTESWAQTHRIKEYVEKFKPGFVVLSIGSNELFVKDVQTQRADDVNAIISELDTIPFVWVGPPNWKPDTGIGELIRNKVGDERYFQSNRLNFNRAKDGMHPSRFGARVWMDSIAVWMASRSLYKFDLAVPENKSASPDRLILLTPND